ncbi:lysophospholipid acyltransferase family protein [Actinomadura livida]|uniref:1-acyl-sn-glycerol-3-phosphate acyltransferase n=1 Tax=Actinomadura livida TaxID=79909 RepID=A0A7W7N1X7_9ACTN|nr:MULTISPECIES: lysophospholipid acyltransferase family protein [Actinomadura]MBB4778387.1 1-acyl-sn-glycerol-3-phosphate acyltransferase [Actinomadura catellatispora]GGU24864.1 glycerol acyltransferase [Actinomadura livida]
MMMNAHREDDEGAQVIHLASARDDDPSGHAERGPLERGIASGLAFLRRRLSGEYEVDEFGFDPEFNDTVLLPLARALYEHWFRVELVGLDNIPEGGALLVANHSGTIPLDALMLSVGVHDHAGRHVRLLGADLVYQIPVLGHLSRKAGHTLACKADAARLLSKGELVGVFPEGYKGVGKPFAERYKLQRFGRGGFVGTALRAGVPIVPCAIVGAEEIYPKIAEVRPLARLLGLPYFPVTPTFPLLGPAGLLPLPSKWMIQFGEPMTLDEYDADSADDPMTVFNITDHVRENVQQMLFDTLLRRGPAFL